VSAIVVQGDAARLPLPDASVDLIITSPPYWSMRRYEGGADGQIGLEETAVAYLQHLWAVMDECHRVLRPTGSLWVDLGDKFAGGSGGADGISAKSTLVGNGHRGGVSRIGTANKVRSTPRPKTAVKPDVPNKGLVGLPWRFALGLSVPDLYRMPLYRPMADPLYPDQVMAPGTGPRWILRGEVVWDKPNGMPESVRDRLRRSHEQFFHFVKQPRYYTNIDEIRSRHVRAWAPGKNGGRDGWDRGDHLNVGLADAAPHPKGSLPGSVWRIANEPLQVPPELKVKHYAAFPSEWPRRIITGFSPLAVCLGCNQGRSPVSDRQIDLDRPQARRAMELAAQHGLTDDHIAAVRAVGVSDVGRAAATQTGTGRNTDEVLRLAAEAKDVLRGYTREFLLGRPGNVIGWSCGCATPTAPTRRSVVLDPFGGTGTVAMMAHALGRIGVHIDRAEDYNRLATWRIFSSGHAQRTLAKAAKAAK
jgi:DNA modification methylase